MSRGGSLMTGATVEGFQWARFNGSGMQAGAQRLGQQADRAEVLVKRATAAVLIINENIVNPKP